MGYFRADRTAILNIWLATSVIGFSSRCLVIFTGLNGSPRALSVRIPRRPRTAQLQCRVGMTAPPVCAAGPSNAQSAGATGMTARPTKL